VKDFLRFSSLTLCTMLDIILIVLIIKTHPKSASTLEKVLYCFCGVMGVLCLEAAVLIYYLGSTGRVRLSSFVSAHILLGVSAALLLITGVSNVLLSRKEKPVHANSSRVYSLSNSSKGSMVKQGAYGSY
jgi:hypothetical protein